jgi:peptidoglycan/xylan/chitin deacetylase (PgdA/CDA1 family)
MRAYQKARLLTARARGGGHDWRGVRVLGYHRLDRERHTLSVRPDDFRAQLDAALGAGLRPVSLDAALALLARPVDGRYLHVTFDDGYRDNLEHGEPVLRELGVPATIFVATAAIDGRATFDWFERQPPLLTWEELEELERGGVVAIGAHTRTHPHLPKVDAERAGDEVLGSRRDLEDRLGRPPAAFAYPAGLYGPRDVELVRAAGFRAAVTTRAGVNDHGTPPLELRRTMVYGEDSRADFAVKIAGLVDSPPLGAEWWHRRRAAA